MSQPDNSRGSEITSPVTADPQTQSRDHKNKEPKGKVSLVKKVTLIIVAAFTLLLLLASLLLFTHTGNALLWEQLSRSLAPLHGELAEGQLMTGWNFRNLQWHDAQISFQAEEVTLKWQFGKLLTTLFTTKELPIELIEVRQGHLEVQPTAGKESSPTTTTNSNMNIPLDILIDQINIQNFTFASSGTNISLDSFEAKAQFLDNQLTIPEILADNLQIQLASQESASINKKPLVKAKQSVPVEFDLSKITLPEIKLPIPIKLKQFTLTNAHYQQGEIDETVDRMDLSFDWQSSNIKSLQLNVNQTRANALLTGDIQLSENYPLNIDLNVTVLDDFTIPELSAIKGEKLFLKASGDLSRLQLQLSTQGAVNASLAGSVGPLAPNMPLDLTVTWPELKWPLQTETPQVSADSGSMRLVGNLNQYQLSLNTSVRMAEQPASNVTLISSGNLEQLNIAELSINLVDNEKPTATLEKTVKLQGDINWKDGIHWQGQVHLAQLKPDLWFPDIPGIINGRVDTRLSIKGAMSDGRWQVSIPELSLTGSLLNNPLEIAGKIEVNNQVRPMAALPVKVIVQELSASLGDNHLNINGQIAEQLSLKTTINANDLDVLHPDLKGKVRGDILLSGSDENPKLSFNVESPSITFQQTNIDKLQANGELTKTILLEGNVAIEVNSLSSGSLQLKQLALTAKGNERNHQLSLKTLGEPVSGELLINGVWQSAHVKSAPGKRQGQWQGQLDSAHIVTPVDDWSLEKPVAILLNTTGEVRLTQQCWLAQPARLCIEASQFSANRGSTRFQLADFNLSNLTPFLPGNLTWKAILSGSGDIQWDGGHPVVHLQVQTTPGEIISDSENPVSVKYQQLSTVINLNEDDLRAQFDFESKQLGLAHINLTVDNMQTDQKLSGQANIKDMRLYFLQPLIPDINNIDGILSADTRMGGTLKKPLLFGSLKLSQGQMVTKQEMVKISDLVTLLNVDGDKGKISGRMKVGDGEMKLSGHLDWQQMPPTGVIEMKGQNLGAKVPGILQLRASPDLKLTIGEAQVLTGKITIPWARVNVKQLPKQAITPSNDVVIITPGTRETLIHAGPPFSMDVNVVLGKDIKIDAYGLKSNLSGHLLLDLQPGKPLVADGSIQLINGRYHQFGQDLLIKEGNIIFSGPLSSPYLAVNAIRNPENIEDDVTVGIQVSGPPTRPEFSIYSDPSMPQQEQWSYLLRGRGLEDGDSSAVQSMLIGFGVSQFGGVVSTLGEAVGLSDVTLDTQGSGDNTQVTIGGNINRRLRVQYGAGVFNSIAEVKVRYELMPRLYLQAVSGIAQAIDLFYQFKIETGKK